VSERQVDLRRNARDEHTRFAAALPCYCTDNPAWPGTHGEPGAGRFDPSGPNPPDNRPAGSFAADEPPLLGEAMREPSREHLPLDRRLDGRADAGLGRPLAASATQADSRPNPEKDRRERRQAMTLHGPSIPIQVHVADPDPVRLPEPPFYAISAGLAERFADVRDDPGRLAHSLAAGVPALVLSGDPERQETAADELLARPEGGRRRWWPCFARPRRCASWPRETTS
jgi:hypothetical protein